jgi:starvation-inducible outer membrane lipoprotein
MIQFRIRRIEALVNRLAFVLRGNAAPPPKRLQTAQDVMDLIQEQVEAVRAEPRAGALEKARIIGQLAGVARKAIETGELAARLEILEAVLKERSGATKR